MKRGNVLLSRYTPWQASRPARRSRESKAALWEIVVIRERTIAGRKRRVKEKRRHAVLFSAPSIPGLPSGGTGAKLPPWNSRTDDSPPSTPCAGWTRSASPDWKCSSGLSRRPVPTAAGLPRSASNSPTARGRVSASTTSSSPSSPSSRAFPCPSRSCAAARGAGRSGASSAAPSRSCSSAGPSTASSRSTAACATPPSSASLVFPASAADSSTSSAAGEAPWLRRWLCSCSSASGRASEETSPPQAASTPASTKPSSPAACTAAPTTRRASFASSPPSPSTSWACSPATGSGAPEACCRESSRRWASEPSSTFSELAPFQPSVSPASRKSGLPPSFLPPGESPSCCSLFSTSSSTPSPAERKQPGPCASSA